jgi:hypothetical protein
MDFTTAVYDGSIYIMGGQKGLEFKFSKGIERFNGHSWNKFDFQLPTNLISFGLWEYKTGKYLLFGGRLPSGPNQVMYKLKLANKSHKPIEDVPALAGNYGTTYVGKYGEDEFSVVLSPTELLRFNVRRLEVSTHKL